MEAPKGTSGVVVGYDGSEFAVRALDWATDEAGLRGRTLTLCHAWEELHGTTAETLRRSAQQVMEHGLKRAGANVADRPTRIDLLVDLYEGPPADRLLELSAAAELVVVGAHGRGEAERARSGPPGGAVPGAGGRVGSVGRAVAARASCPVVIVPGAGVLPASGPVAVGVSGGGHTELVLEFACREAAMRHVPLVVVHSWQLHPEFAAAGGAYEPTAVRAAAEERVDRVLEPWRLRYPGVEIEVSAAEGPARQELLEAALDAALLVVGAPYARCGSMTAFMLHHAPCPVAIVRTQEVHP